jgi:hypothetical protein
MDGPQEDTKDIDKWLFVSQGKTSMSKANWKNKYPSTWSNFVNKMWAANILIYDLSIKTVDVPQNIADQSMYYYTQSKKYFTQDECPYLPEKYTRYYNLIRYARQ